VAEKITRRVVSGYSPEGKPYFREVKVDTTEQPPSIDDLQPIGVEGPLSKTPPPRMGGATPGQLEESERSHADWGASRSLPNGDR
jgi:hypothetical protein